MTKRKKRALEREIATRLYNNLTREGISMDHLDPTKLDRWPLVEYTNNKSDYINLLPPSYRNPFSDTNHREDHRLSEATTRPIKNRPLALRQSLEIEWAAMSGAPSQFIAGSQPVKKKHYHHLIPLMITIAGLLLLGSLAFV